MSEAAFEKEREEIIKAFPKLSPEKKLVMLGAMAMALALNGIVGPDKTA